MTRLVKIVTTFLGYFSLEFVVLVLGFDDIYFFFFFTVLHLVILHFAIPSFCHLPFFVPISRGTRRFYRGHRNQFSVSFDYNTWIDFRVNLLGSRKLESTTTLTLSD